ncbi:hypothetical protein IWX85_002044 [Polaromonas sp. CG_9.11]|nr:hypothetical protein [Polaromonas sp. CG_9.11]MBG6076214.1 hypothetical protein [Polaromonas sp. CG_9.11]
MIDHRFALSKPILVSAPSKKSFSIRQLIDPGVQRLQIDHRLGAAMIAPKPVGCPLEKLILQVADLVGVNVKLLRQLGQHFVALQSGHGHLGLKYG